jgi:hypothetical protein
VISNLKFQAQTEMELSGKQKPKKTEAPPPEFDEVLKRTLSTLPKPHPKLAKKIAKKKTAK